MLSLDSFKEAMKLFTADQVWDVPFALTMAGPPAGAGHGGRRGREGGVGSRSGGGGGQGVAGGARRECIFPEMPRTKHVGQATHSGKGWLTTSASAQHLWFDLMALNRDSSSVAGHQVEPASCSRASARRLLAATFDDIR